MMFGDRPAAAALEVTLNKVAELGKSIDPEASEMIRDGYVDDGASGGEDEDLDWMMGEEVDPSTGEVTFKGTIQQIVSLGGFKLKLMVRSGRNQDSALEKFNGSVLGVLWDPSKDVIRMHMGVNLSPKRQKIRQGPELTLETIGALDDAPLTRRIIASQVSGIYDPMGLCCPVTIKFKMLLQEIVVSGTDWDEPLEPELDKKAWEALREIVQVKGHRLPPVNSAQGCPGGP